jgi:hypothetical protein
VIRIIENAKKWNAVLEDADFPYFTNIFEWLECFKDTYGMELMPLGYEENGEIKAVFPVMIDKKRNELFSPTPFGGVGGSSKTQYNTIFIDHLEQLSKQLKIKRVTIHLPPLDETKKTFVSKGYRIEDCFYFVQKIDGLNFEQAISRWKKDELRNYKKAIKKGVELTTTKINKDNIKLFYQFYEHVMTRNRAKIVFPIELFLKFYEKIGQMTDISIAYIGKIPIGASIVFKYKDRLMTWFVVTHKDYFKTRANTLLFAGAVKNALENNCKMVDFGPSSPSDGSFVFKKKLDTEIKKYATATKIYSFDIKNKMKIMKNAFVKREPV